MYRASIALYNRMALDSITCQIQQVTHVGVPGGSSVHSNLVLSTMMRSYYVGGKTPQVGRLNKVAADLSSV